MFLGGVQSGFSLGYGTNNKTETRQLDAFHDQKAMKELVQRIITNNL